MPQVSRTTNDLIINAFYTIGELGVGERPDAYMLESGLYLLNELLDQFSSSGVYIPFLTTVDFVLQAGKGTYSISNIGTADIISERPIDIVFANYLVETMSYPLRVINKAQYYNTMRLTTLNARPSCVVLDKQEQSSFLIFYPNPDQPYPCQVQLKVMLDKLEPFDIIDEVPPYFQRFLRLALARNLISYYPSANFSPQDEDEYQRIFADLKSGNETDLTIRNSNILEAPSYFPWPYILAY
jgi:hypothetical protein